MKPEQSLEITVTKATGEGYLITVRPASPLGGAGARVTYVRRDKDSLCCLLGGLAYVGFHTEGENGN